VTGPMGDPLVADDAAPLGRRALGYIADVATVATWLWALSIAHVAFWMRWSDDVAVGPWGEQFIPAVSFTILFVIYQVLFVSRTGTTPGHDLLRLQVLSATTGKRPTFGSALARGLLVGLIWLMPQVWPAVVLAALIGVSGLRSSEGRMFHDELSHTTVVLRLVPDLEPGQTVEEAEKHRRQQFLPRMVNPFQINSMQLFRHPHLRRIDDDPED
jgi:uncharacterized RDD family membrane protein YckC